MPGLQNIFSTPKNILSLEQMDVGDFIRDTVEAAIRRSAVFIPLLTPAYIKSTNCQVEHEQARKTHRGRGGMFPVRLEAMEDATLDR